MLWIMEELQPSGGSPEKGFSRAWGSLGLVYPSSPQNHEWMNLSHLSNSSLPFRNIRVQVWSAEEQLIPGAMEDPSSRPMTSLLTFFPDFTSSSGWDLLRLPPSGLISVKVEEDPAILIRPQLPRGYEMVQTLKHCVFAEIACFYCLLFF